MTRLLVLAMAVACLLGPRHDASLAGVSAPDAVSAAATTAVAGGSTYAFSTVIAGQPVRWNPCAAIHYRLRVADAPAGGIAAVRSALARISQATGTHWVDDGTSPNVPTTTWLPRMISQHQPVLIGWTDAAHSDLLRGQPSAVLGVTRTAWFGHTTGSTTVVAIRSAVIALDRTDHLPATGTMSWRSVVLHELGHAMGLDHAASSRELMYPVLQHGLSDLQSGDLRGLAAVGKARGCITL